MAPAASAAAAVAESEEPVAAAPAQPRGVNLTSAAVAVGVGLLVQFVIPVPAGVTPQAWQLLAIFLTTVVGLILEPLPVPAWAFCGLTAAVMTKTLSWDMAFQAFTSEVIWLITVSFFFARGIVQSGLGARIAQIFVAAFGKSTLGLSYGLAAAETVLALGMPSGTARAGGVLQPVIDSISKDVGSTPKENPRRMGAFLTMSQAHGAAAHTSNLFLTASAQNLLVIKLAEEAGVVFANAWMEWLTAALVPVLACMVISPYAAYLLCPPEIKDTPEAPASARAKLKEMGSLSRDEWVMMVALAAAVVIWVVGFGLPGAVGAMLGLCILLNTGVLSWSDCLKEGAGWSTLTWFSVLVGFSGALNQMGLIDWVASNVSTGVTNLGLGSGATIAVLLTAYTLIHYVFASQTAHVASLFPAFLQVIMLAGGAGLPVALAMGYITNLFGGITHFASGQSVVFYNAGYVSLAEFWTLGLKMFLINSVVFAATAIPYWSFLGLM